VAATPGRCWTDRRVNVTRALRGAIRRVAAINPALGEHLDRSIKTGSFCVYRP